VQPRANFSTWARQRLARSLFAAGLRITTVLLTHQKWKMGFDLFFKLGLRNVSA
jgi:hypothetical protein